MPVKFILVILLKHSVFIGEVKRRLLFNETGFIEKKQTEITVRLFESQFCTVR